MKPIFKQKEFSDALKETMFSRMTSEKRRIGLREFAQESGVSYTTLSRIEHGNAPDIETFFRLCFWMKRSSNEFYNHS